MKSPLPVSIVLFTKDVDGEGFYLWMQIRRENGPLDGLYEFPGGKIESTESPEMAARREVEEEVGLRLPPEEVLHYFNTFPYENIDRKIILEVFVSFFNQLPLKKGCWFKINYKSKSSYLKGQIPLVNHHIIDQLAENLSTQYNPNTNYLKALTWY